MHTQHDFISNMKPKKDATFLKVSKASNGPFPLTKQRCDRIPKPKLERSIPAPTPVRHRKLHNCLAVETPSSCEKHLTYTKRKSISLVELSCQNKNPGPKKLSSKEHGDETKIKLIVENANYICHLRKEEYDIARKACKMFILHAWRRRRAQVSALQNKTQSLDNEVQNFNIQIVVLRNLLESEKLRVAIALSDSSHLKGRLENELNTISELRKNLNELEKEKSKLENTQENMLLEIHSLNSKLEKARGEIKTQHEETSQVREKLVASKEMEAQLTTKLGVAESRLKDKTSCLHQLKKKTVDFMAQIAELNEKNRTLCKEGEIKEKEILKAMNEINKKDSELNILQNICNAQVETILDLNKELTNAIKNKNEQEDVINFLEKTINTFRMEREKEEQSRLNLKNQAIFQAIKLFVNLFIPGQHISTM